MSGTHFTDELITRITELPSERQEAIGVLLGLSKPGSRGHGMDLRVPHLRLLEKYKTSSKTEVQWEPGFYGRLRFVPWKAFDKMVEDTWQKVQKLPPDEFFFAGMNLVLLRSMVQGEGSRLVKPKTNLNAHQEGSSSNADRIAAVPSFLENTHSSTESGMKDGRNETSQQGEMFTDERSTTGVNNYVFMAALSLLKGLRKRRVYS